MCFSDYCVKRIQWDEGINPEERLKILKSTKNLEVLWNILNQK